MNKQLTQEIKLNNADGEEPPQNEKEKRSLQDQLVELKKKKKEEFYAFRKDSLKDENTISSQYFYLRKIILIAGDYYKWGFSRLRRKNHVVKVRNILGANVVDMQHNLIPINKKKLSHLIIHVGMNDAKRFTSREILDQLLNLKRFVSEQVLDCKVIISTSTVRSDDGKAELTVSRLIKN